MEPARPNGFQKLDAWNSTEKKDPEKKSNSRLVRSITGLFGKMTLSSSERKEKKKLVSSIKKVATDEKEKKPAPESMVQSVQQVEKGAGGRGGSLLDRQVPQPSTASKRTSKSFIQGQKSDEIARLQLEKPESSDPLSPKNPISPRRVRFSKQYVIPFDFTHDMITPEVRNADEPTSPKRRSFKPRSVIRPSPKEPPTLQSKGKASAESPSTQEKVTVPTDSPSPLRSFKSDCKFMGGRSALVTALEASRSVQPETHSDKRKAKEIHREEKRVLRYLKRFKEGKKAIKDIMIFFDEKVHYLKEFYPLIHSEICTQPNYYEIVYQMLEHSREKSMLFLPFRIDSTGILFFGYLLRRESEILFGAYAFYGAAIDAIYHVAPNCNDLCEKSLFPQIVTQFFKEMSNLVTQKTVTDSLKEIIKCFLRCVTNIEELSCSPKEFLVSTFFFRCVCSDLVNVSLQLLSAEREVANLRRNVAKLCEEVKYITQDLTRLTEDQLPSITAIKSFLSGS